MTNETMEASQDTESSEEESAWWIPIWEFLIHTVVGSALFALIVLPAIGLYWFVGILETSSAQMNMMLSPILVWTFHLVEAIIIGTDVLLFVYFMASSVRRTIRRL